MSVKAVILGFLRQGPLHGYELKRIIEQAMGDWTDIAFGSIYFALDRLLKDGCVTATEEIHNKRRPSKIVYTITDSGQQEYLRLLRELWMNLERKTNSIDIAVSFIRDLPQVEVSDYLTTRVGTLERTLSYLKIHEKETMDNPQVPPESRYIFSHARYQLEAELAWTKELLQGTH